MLLLSKRDIDKVFSMADAIQADKDAFRLAAEGKIETPLRTVIRESHHDGAFLVMPSYAPDRDAAAVKLINIFPQNAQRGRNTAPAQVLLMDGATGELLAMLDGTRVTQLRTGASSGAAFDLLGRKNAKIGGLIGTGGQAAAQLEAMLTVRDLDEVLIYSRDQARCRAFCERMTKQLAPQAKLIPAEHPDQVAEAADLLIAVTSSATPVFDGTKVKAGATISCVGTYQPEKHELDPVVLPRAGKIFCDSVEAVLEESGDLLIPLAQGLIKAEDITGSLGDLLLGRCFGRESEEEIIVYETVGIAAQDLISAQAIYERAKAAGIGTQWDSGD